MTPKTIPLSNEKCSYHCPYYMDGPVLSLCRFTNEQLVYGGTIPPKRTERCKQEISNHDKIHMPRISARRSAVFGKHNRQGAHCALLSKEPKLFGFSNGREKRPSNTNSGGIFQ